MRISLSLSLSRACAHVLSLSLARSLPPSLLDSLHRVALTTRVEVGDVQRTTDCASELRYLQKIVITAAIEVGDMQGSTDWALFLWL